MSTEELVQAEKELQHAVRSRDRLTVERFVASEFRLTGSKSLAPVVDRNDWISYAIDRFTWEAEFEFKEIVANVYEDCAIVVARITERTFWGAGCERRVSCN